MTFSMMYKKLWLNFEIIDKIKFILLCFLAFLISIFEVISISSILPFVSIMIGLDQPEVLQQSEKIGNFYRYAQTLNKFTLLSCFISIIALTAVVRLSTIYLNTTFSFKIGNKLCGKILSNTLSLDFEDFSRNHTSHYVNGIFRKTGVLMQNVILGVVQLVGNIIIVAIISLTLISLYGTTTLQIISFIVMIYTATIILVGPFTRFASAQTALQTTKALRVLGELLGSFSEIRINSRRRAVVSEYKKVDVQFRKAEAQSVFVSQAPRYIIEALVIIFLSTYIYMATENRDDTSSLLFVLTTIVVALQKLLPYAQQIYSVLIGLRVNKIIFEETIVMLNSAHLPNIKQADKKINFCEKIELKDLEYTRTHDDTPSLEPINAIIKAGKWTVITGKTGSGKTTLMNILLGLLKPSSGDILVDGKKIQIYEQEGWFSNVSVVDQRPFFPNVSILQMITGSNSETVIDRKLMRKVLHTCLLADLVDQKIDKLGFIIGENANKLSGGQRQRLAIASALYHEKPILMLDEATNALDERTQAELLINIKNEFPDITIIMIAHRTEILPFFDNVINLSV